MIRYDVPAMVTRVLRVTGHSQIYYCGHSQGTMVMFGGLSRNKTLAAQVSRQWCALHSTMVLQTEMNVVPCWDLNILEILLHSVLCILLILACCTDFRSSSEKS